MLRTPNSNSVFSTCTTNKMMKTNESGNVLKWYGKWQMANDTENVSQWICIVNWFENNNIVKNINSSKCDRSLPLV